MKGWKTLKEAAEILGIAHDTIRSYITRKQIDEKHYQKIGRDWFVSDVWIKTKLEKKEGLKMTIEQKNMAADHLIDCAMECFDECYSHGEGQYIISDLLEHDFKRDGKDYTSYVFGPDDDYYLAEKSEKIGITRENFSELCDLALERFQAQYEENEDEE